MSKAGQPLKPGFTPETVREVLEAGGTLPINQVLRCRVRYFTGGSFSIGVGGNAAPASYLRIFGGTVRITGDAATLVAVNALETSATSTLEFVLKDGGITTFDVTGNAALQDVTLDAGFVLPTGATDYTLISAGSLSGAVGTTNLPSAAWSVSYVDSDVVLSYAGSGATAGTLILVK